MKKLAILILFFVSISAFGNKINNSKISLITGISANYYTDYNSVFSIKEGLNLSTYYTLFTTINDSLLNFGLSTGIKTGLSFEAAVSMKRAGIPNLFPLLIPICPGVKGSMYLGNNWEIFIDIFTGPNILLYNNLYPSINYTLDLGLGVAWYCFKTSGFEISVKYGFIGNDYFFQGAGANLTYCWRN